MGLTYYKGLLLTAFCLSACTAGDVLPGDEGNNGDGASTPLMIAALYHETGKADTRATEKADTRAASKELTSADGSVGFYLSNANGYTPVSNREGTYNTTDNCWKPTTDILLSASQATLAVYYPHSTAHGTSGSVLSLTSAQYTAAATTKGLWCASFTANRQTVGKSLSVTLKQLYACLSVTFVKDATYKGTGKLATVSLNRTGMITGATYDVFTAAYTTTSGNTLTASSLNLTIGAGTQSSPAANVEFLLVPQTWSSGSCEISATVDGKEMKIAIPYTTLGDLKPGVQYNLTITLKPTALTIGTLNYTTDWNEVANATLDDKVEF